jgi:hypothetical protein
MVGKLSRSIIKVAQPLLNQIKDPSVRRIATSGMMGGLQGAAGGAVLGGAYGLASDNTSVLGGMAGGALIGGAGGAGIGAYGKFARMGARGTAGAVAPVAAASEAATSAAPAVATAVAPNNTSTGVASKAAPKGKKVIRNSGFSNVAQGFGNKIQGLKNKMNAPNTLNIQQPTPGAFRSRRAAGIELSRREGVDRLWDNAAESGYGDFY